MKFVLKVFALISLVVVGKLTKDQSVSERTSIRKVAPETQVFSQNFEPATYILQRQSAAAFDKGSLKLN